MATKDFQLFLSVHKWKDLVTPAMHNLVLHLRLDHGLMGHSGTPPMDLAPHVSVAKLRTRSTFNRQARSALPPSTRQMACHGIKEDVARFLANGLTWVLPVLMATRTDLNAPLFRVGHANSVLS